MPEHLFHRSIVLLCGTYLTPVHRILHQWRKLGFAPVTTQVIYQEAQTWLQRQKPNE
jgi:hypothetical protein